MVRLMDKKYVIIGIVILFAVYIAFFSDSSSKNFPGPQEGYSIPRGSIHWHSYLTIYIKGEQRVIPQNIGLGSVHQPLHTHDFTGELHMENQNPSARPETLTLGYLFSLWGETFNQTCLFEFCNGSDGTVKMYVNGVENNRFGDYYMSDGDQIEIRYE